MYSKNLFKNVKTKNLIVINSVSFKLDTLLEITNRPDFDLKNLALKSKHYEKRAYGMAANKMIKALLGLADVYQFWSREKGFNQDLL